MKIKNTLKHHDIQASCIANAAWNVPIYDARVITHHWLNLKHLKTFHLSSLLHKRRTYNFRSWKYAWAISPYKFIIRRLKMRQTNGLDASKRQKEHKPMISEANRQTTKSDRAKEWGIGKEKRSYRACDCLHLYIFSCASDTCTRANTQHALARTGWILLSVHASRQATIFR